MVESLVITVATFLDMLIAEFGLNLVDISFKSRFCDALIGGKKAGLKSLLRLSHIDCQPLENRDSILNVYFIDMLEVMILIYWNAVSNRVGQITCI